MGEILIGDMICDVEWLCNLSIELMEHPCTDRYYITPM